MGDITANHFKHGSLFSGIGGFDLAAEWMGWENVFHCEWMPFPRKVLNYYWPNAISYEDITKTDFSIHRGTIDILTGGFPCQPYSGAGKRLGKEDERHLWPHMLRAIREIEPTFVVGENVRGLTNWNGGVVFEEVCTDLEACGYEVQPLLLPACAIGAPHRRDRVWFVAYSKNNGWNERRKEINEWEINKFQNRYEIWNKSSTNGKQLHVANSEFVRLEHSKKRGSITESERTTHGKRSQFAKYFKTNGWSRFPTQSPICGGDDGIPNQLDGITFSNWRKESIKGYGNAIVPQLAYQIFKSIQYLNDNEIQNQL
jgi:DNA (cytosine-5)-methyltransferase 1